MGPNTCECGRTKDRRADQCSECYRGRISRSETKLCTGRCARVLPLESFKMRRDQWSKGTKRRARCSECEAADAREYQGAKRASTPREERSKAKKLEYQRVKADRARWFRLSIRASARRLGLDPDLVWRRAEEVGNTCEACGYRPTLEEQRVSVDHCHATGTFRGFLCAACNFIAGHSGDDPERLRAVAAYLERTKF